MFEGEEPLEDLYYFDRPEPTNGNSQDPSEYGNVIEMYGSRMTSCGYCDRGDGREERRVFDVRAHKLTANAYQQMIDQGWRRSGGFCYFPFNRDTCCPNYSISCSATKFELTRSQIKCIDKVYSFLINDSTREKVKLSNQFNESFRVAKTIKQTTNWTRDVKYTKDNFDKLKTSPNARDRRFVASCERNMRLHNINLEETVRKIRAKPRNNRDRLKPTLEDYLYPRKTNLNAKFLDSLKPKHKLQIRLVHVDSEASKDIRQKEHEILVKYQGVIHNETPEEWSMPRFEQFLIKSPIKTEPLQDRDYISSETSGDESGSGDTRSIELPSSQCDEFAFFKPPELPTHFGTYHCLYLLDDELIAVGVIDFLPKCLTTVYFFYNPQFSSLNLGIFSALVEVSIVRRLFKHYQGLSDKNLLKYYYMGFYVHQSKKMHYKTSFRPSYLLCPLTRHYVPVEKCLPILRERKYARFDTDHEPVSIGIPTTILFQIPVSAPVLGNNTTRLLDYFRWLKSNTCHADVEQLLDSFLVQYTAAVGENLLSQILVKLDPIHEALVERHRSKMARSRSRNAHYA